MTRPTAQVKKLGEEYERALPAHAPREQRSHEDSGCGKGDVRELMVTSRGCRGRQLLQSCW
ncbi:hypothetical protein K474DRAFT_1667340 [Panus rudis PR-1116 ss-1]|nr:hypothetical protein K474DRAFT_1669971 [Panus rudis PR-1116 ss-1]KAI0071706.1 hypothetical protein K474DRAFT_1668746 [Panus rudis PR-1116 ss-1]KAI0072847.1 hypothetical protein K474DRAFT_1667340 [Panus rudis PR-1116 ss-1]